MSCLEAYLFSQSEFSNGVFFVCFFIRHRTKQLLKTASGPQNNRQSFELSMILIKQRRRTRKKKKRTAERLCHCNRTGATKRKTDRERIIEVSLRTG